MKDTVNDQVDRFQCVPPSNDTALLPNAVLAPQIGSSRCLVVAQHTNNLLFSKPGSFHLSVLQEAGL
jgi:hypothetical protein